jgi:hypothetical protein
VQLLRAKHAEGAEYKIRDKEGDHQRVEVVWSHLIDVARLPNQK